MNEKVLHGWMYQGMMRRKKAMRWCFEMAQMGWSACTAPTAYKNYVDVYLKPRRPWL